MRNFCRCLCNNLMWHQLIVSSGGTSSTTGHRDNRRAGEGVQRWTQLFNKDRHYCRRLTSGKKTLIHLLEKKRKKNLTTQQQFESIAGKGGKHFKRIRIGIISKHANLTALNPPVWGTRCRELRQGTWRGRWRAWVGGDWAEQKLQLARLRSGTPVCLLRGCRPPTWPLWTRGGQLSPQRSVPWLLTRAQAWPRSHESSVCRCSQTDGRHMLQREQAQIYPVY